MRYLLDTSAVLAHFRLEPGHDVVSALLENPACDVSIAAPSLPELGRRLRELEYAETDLEAVIAQYATLLEVVSVDQGAAMAAFRVLSVCRPRLPMVDALIAGAALATGAVLVQRDLHMAAIPESLLTQEALPRK